MGRFKSRKGFFLTAMNINVIYSILADKKVLQIISFR